MSVCVWFACVCVQNVRRAGYTGSAKWDKKEIEVALDGEQVNKLLTLTAY